MTDKFAPRRIGLFGGTFDPVHLGHLQIASQLKSTLNLDAMHMVLAARPPLRRPPVASAEQRWEMLKLALLRYPELTGDNRELGREGVSYSYDTLAEIRSEMGEQAAVAWCIGWDGLVSLPSWHRWKELLELCALIVVNRPHHADGGAELDARIAARLVSDAESENLALRVGQIIEVAIEPISISATQIRTDFADGENPEAWLTPEVFSYIEQNQLYGTQ